MHPDKNRFANATNLDLLITSLNQHISLFSDRPLFDSLSFAYSGCFRRRLAKTNRDADTIRMNELVFEVVQEDDGGFCAECLSENIFTQGNTWDAVRQNVLEAVRAFYFDQPQKPKQIRLHLVRDELLASA